MTPLLDEIKSVLAPLVQFAELLDEDALPDDHRIALLRDGDGIRAEIVAGDARAARSLLSRIEALNQEGGDAADPAGPVESVLPALKAIAEGYPVRVSDDRYICVENPDFRPDDGSHPGLVIDVVELSRLEALINQEGGGCHRTLGETRAVHVAPPASGNNGSGRAPSGRELIDDVEEAFWIYKNSGVIGGRAARRNLLNARQALLDHIVAMHAAGRRSGIEEAAKVADAECERYGLGLSNSAIAKYAVAQIILDSIRALNTGEAS